MKSITFLFLIISASSYAQESDYLNDFLKPDFHEGRRQVFRDKMPNNSVAVFFANPIRNRSNDVDYVYHQASNFFYLTGYREPGAVLLLFKEFQHSEEIGEYDEIVFSQTSLNKRPVFDGEVLGPEGVKSLGFEAVLDAQKFDKFEIDFSKFDFVLQEKFFNDVRDNPSNPADLFSLIEQFKEKIESAKNLEIVSEGEYKMSVNTTRIREIMTELREIKLKEEIDMLRKAIDISCIGQREVMKGLHPGMSESEIQGIHEFVYKKYGAEYEGYPSIVGAGHNGCILHYIKNDKMKVKDDLVLMDLGAEYHGYTADVTRTIPADGKFTKEQAAIYNLVLKAQEAAFKNCKPGNTFSKSGWIARDVINKGLAKLGIIESEDHEHFYFPHGLSHHIGLDVHDPGQYKKYEENMVITIEPGIYIPIGSDCDEKWWGIAVRIEDDILITEDGYELLSNKAPRTIKAIEELIEQDNIFSEYDLPPLKGQY
ncbi:aminopeptidase P family protein [Reichenbachiella versicolor]|uniref:aminopeptidase P family protein n=1 Tax=Reichenbachiella versicolor TaxID=1821036 RepID=UPI000D6E8C66|nr:aminopeptidase P family protein [Reichenbachiella versicolor]